MLFRSKLADVYHYDLYGKRDFKYEFLDENNLKTIKWDKLDYSEPNYFFVKKDFTEIKEYEKGFKLDELFLNNGTGFETQQDDLVISIDEYEIDNKKQELDNIVLKNEKIIRIISDIKNATIEKVLFKLFDYRYSLYSKNSSGVMGRPKYELLKNMLKENFALLTTRLGTDGFTIFISNLPTAHKSATAYDKTVCFPLYLYPDENSLTNETVPNFNMDIIKDIEKSLNLNFGNWTLVQSLEKAGGTEVPLPKEKIGGSEVLLPKKEFQALDLFDYIYAVLHSTSYREKYKEFLKIDFPRVPYPKPETFWQLVSLGGKLRSLHLLEDTSLDERIIDIKGEGELLIKNSLNKKDFSIEDEKVELRLNDEVSVVNIPLVAWEFYIGGYQPAQKWLKDRVGRVLSRADMKHYNRIINALCKTDLIMKKIDEVAKF